MNVSLLKELSEAHGIGGKEDALRTIVRRELGPLCDCSTDYMGNLICVKKGTGGDNAPKLMLAAHMDEIGFVVKHIDDKGFIRIHTLGGWDPRQMGSQRVKVHTRSEVLPGTLMQSVKPKHMLSGNEGNQAPKVEEFFVDLGLSGEEVKKRVKIGDMITMDREFRAMGELYSGKAMDDRAAVYVMIEALKAVGPHACDVYAVATVQEEIGLRGAAASGSAIKPDVVVAIDITLANDIPGIPDQDCITKLGQGTAIKVMDSSLICHPKVVDHFVDLAEKHSIKYQMELLPFGGTDAGGIQRLNGGIPALTLSIPTRYVHTVNETVHPDDVDASVALLARYIEDCGARDYRYAE